MTRSRHAEIAGAGFAGLASAIALRQRGWTARVHESNPELRAFGAGIFIWDNGLHVLDSLGAYRDVLDGAFACTGYETRTDGVTRSFEPVNSPGSLRLLTMTRQHLYQAMLSAARRVGVELVTSSEAIGATPEGELLLADGSRLKADLVIGADGVKSKVRDSLQLPMERKAYQDGLIRVLTDRGPLKGGEWDRVIDFWATRERTLRILYTPCGENTLYMAMMAPLNDPAANAIPVDPEIWSAAFPALRPVLTTLADRGRYDLYEKTVLKTWSSGKVAIVGDSAHAMPPTLAQGAGCAIMNALGLAVATEETDTVEEALALWQRRERPLTDHTQSRAAELAASRSLASGMAWDDVGLRAARHLPTGTVAEFSAA
ncbi:NAD(P)/FAD-dependent oxidoreductase [Xylophilus sp. GOD-11R]|uniref:FAD-dependent oxidoreductase n=1 Tax=Xylophilus sp. GOD-11R TaxID=3089814 RepID=UPI00298C2F7F|nr:NAD(P)/FAD-dependent oxidoreductase [Xylophilus sp. GOD-11R]WPB57453.1 NAD(P)/FAD-dependent oxidoreductase [Xylophilus sp. GOD-11R]